MRKKLGLWALILGMYLGLYNGHIALWDDAQTQPMRVFPYRAALYPKLDQDLLAHGIPVSDAETLSKLLEDYLS